MKIKSIRKACKITDKLFSKLISNFNVFKTEKEIELFLKKETKKLNLRPAFQFVIASGKNASNPHHKPTKQKLQKGFCIIDFGVRVNSYCSDMSRTVYIGKPTKKEKELYNLVLGCQRSCINNIKLNRKYCNIDLHSRKLFKGYRKCFIHGLGHGLGKRIHQKPKINPKSEDLVKIGDIITIEPGLYFENKAGIRIEDDILVKKKGIEILTKATKKLIII